MTSKPATMATQEGESLIREIIRKPPIKSNMDIVEAGEVVAPLAQCQERLYAFSSWLQVSSESRTRIGID